MKSIVKTQIELPSSVDKMLKMIKVEFDLTNKSQAVEFVVEAFKGEFRPEVEAKFAEVMTSSHVKISKKRAKSVKAMNKEFESW